MYVCIYIYIIYVYLCICMDFEGFGPSRIWILRGGIFMPTGNFPEVGSRQILAGMTVVGTLGVYQRMPMT